MQNDIATRAMRLDRHHLQTFQVTLENAIKAHVDRSVTGHDTPDLYTLQCALELVCTLLGVHSWAMIGE
jgi:hypothetical protein